MKRLAGLCLLTMLAAGCTKETPRITQGTLLVKGNVTGLYRSPDGRAVATLVDALPSRIKGAPSDLLTGSLYLASTTTGASQRLGGGVTNLPDSLMFSPDGQWLAFLSGYSVARAEGELQLVKASGGEPMSLGTGVSYYAFSADGGHLAWVADGQLSIRSAADGKAKVVTEGVSTMAFGPKDTPAQGTLLIKRSLKSGGALLSYDVGSEKLRAIASGTRTFAFAPNGSAAFQATKLLKADEVAPESVLAKKADQGRVYPSLYLAGKDGAKKVSAESVTEFRFSADGQRLAFLTPPTLGQATGDLWLFDGKDTKRIVTRVQSFEFAPDGSVVLLGAWEPSAAAGTLGVSGLDGTLREIARNVKQFSLSPRGGTVLFSQLVPVGGTYSLNLSLQALDAPKDATPRQVAVGVYGYTIDPSEKLLAYKSNCLEKAKACTLYVTGLGAANESTVVAERVAAFEFLPGRSDLAVIASRHTAKYDPRLLYTLALTAPTANATLKVLDDQMTGEFQVAGDRLAWLVSEPGREGLYAAPFDAALTVAEAKDR